MTDAIDLLLRDKPGARQLLDFHHAYPTFLPQFVAEFRWLKKQGRGAAGAQSVFHYLRWAREWHGMDEFGINQNLAALAVRVCVIVWPDINGMAKLVRCKADDILGTRIRRRKGYGSRLLWPVVDLSGVCLPAVSEVERAPSFHVPITTRDANQIEADFSRMVAAAPDPESPRLKE